MEEHQRWDMEEIDITVKEPTSPIRLTVEIEAQHLQLVAGLLASLGYNIKEIWRVPVPPVAG